MAGKNNERRERIKVGVRKKISGTTERPRLSVFRSNKGLFAQVIDDVKWNNDCVCLNNRVGRKG